MRRTRAGRGRTRQRAHSHGRAWRWGTQRVAGATHHCSSLSTEKGPRGRGVKWSRSMRGKHDCVKQVMLTWCPLYLLRILTVASCVRKLFISTRGTSTPNLVFKYSTWRTVRSRKVRPDLQTEGRRNDGEGDAEVRFRKPQHETAACSAGTAVDAPDRDRALGALAAHGGAQTSVQLDDRDLVEQLVVKGDVVGAALERGVLQQHVLPWRIDLRPARTPDVIEWLAIDPRHRWSLLTAPAALQRTNRARVFWSV